MSYIREEQILQLERKIKEETIELQSAIDSFQSKSQDLQGIINALSVCYNTEGGRRKRNEIANIEFEPSDLSQVKDAFSSIDCNHSKYKVSLFRSYIE